MTPAEAAMSWIGTPYRHQHSTKGAGCDCLGLLRGVYREVIGPEPEVPPPYSPSWGEKGPTEYMLDAANRWLDPVKRTEDAEVLIFRMRHGMMAKHCAIVVAPGRMVHADALAGMVTESLISGYWLDRIAGRFRFKW